jgi:hypothetical protein
VVTGNKAIEPTFFFQSKEAEQIRANEGLWIFAPEFVQLSIFEDNSKSLAYSIAFDLFEKKSPQTVLRCVEWAFNQAAAIGGLSEFKCISHYDSPSVFPSGIFTQKEQEQLFQFENSALDEGEFLPSTHSKLEIDCLERVPKWLVHGMSQFSSSAFHWTGGMNALLKNSRLESKSYLKALILPQNLDVFIVIHGKMELCNRFHYKTVSDCLYFLMLSAQQSPIKLADDSIELIGFHPKSNEIIERLSHYVKNLHTKYFNAQFPNSLNQFIQ